MRLKQQCSGCSAQVVHDLDAREVAAGVLSVDKQCPACGARVKLAVDGERSVTNVDRVPS